MTEVVGSNDEGGYSLPLANLPPAALQAIYHYVTQKTENMSQAFEGNVLIYSKDVDRLHQMVLDQMATHQVDFGPTVTVEMKHANERSFQHSSWEHYKQISPATNEITSEITIKFEFVLNLQNTIGPQRCSISILLDSALPLIQKDNKESDKHFAFWMFISREWVTAKVSIDFVDFMIARGFVNIIQEWFISLAPSPTPKSSKKFLEGYSSFSNISAHMGRIGFAIFVAFYVYSNNGIVTLGQISYAVCMGLTIWSIYMAGRPYILKKIHNRITGSIVPSVLLLTDRDAECYQTISESIASTRGTISGMIATIMLSFAVNILSSYIYTHLNGN